MKRNYKFFFSFLLFISVFAFFPVQAEDKDKIILEWDNIEFAHKYKIEIKDKSGRIFLKKITSKNKIELELEPNDYEKRITVINKLGEVDTVSDWIPFSVRLAEGRIKITQKWEKIPGAQTYILEIENEEGKTIQRRKTEALELELGLNPGNYKKRLLVLNKLGEVELESEWITFSVVEIFIPELKDPNKKETLTIENKKPVISLEGIHFQPGIEILLESSSNKIPIIHLENETENKINMTLDLENIPLGIYQLKMKNIRSKQSIYPYFLKLEKPEKDKFLSKRLENWEILLRSATFSGWGEYYAGDTYNKPVFQKRGAIYSGLFIITGFYLLKLRNDFQRESKDLEKESVTNIGLTAVIPDELATAKTFMIANSASKIYSSNTTLQYIAEENLRVSAILLTIYLVQLVDAYFINRDVNRLYESARSGFKLDITKEAGASLIQKPQENYLFYYRFSF